MNDKKQPWYILNSPELGTVFQTTETVFQQNSILEDKTNALIRLALAALLH
ncbi:MAG: hypothetical protein HQ515_08995, partial [Phycisphaeraceae bacterium]|nr:hypothetical protein [Phycisphaeraceae bacterium]